jgi:hypothetical protein
MADPRTQLVADAYDAIGETFAAWRERIVGDPREEWEAELVARLPIFSGWEPEVNSRLVREAGFRIEREKLVTFEEPEGPATFQWILAERE